MNLSPAYIPWALKFFSMLAVAGFIGWMFWHRPMARVLRRMTLGDGIAAWLAYAAAFHLAHLSAWRSLLGEPLALWLLLAALGGYLLLRLFSWGAPRQGLLMTVMVLSWALAIMAGFRFADQAEAAAEVMAARPGAVTRQAAPVLAPLRYGLMLGRLEAGLRDPVSKALAMQTGAIPRDQAFLVSFRLQLLPRLRAQLSREVGRSRTLLWVELALLAAVMALWGYGQPPNWEEVA
ncbi:MAG: hypothetical protein V3S64_15565 [bacterium]